MLEIQAVVQKDLARTLWNSAMRRVRLHTQEGMSPWRGRVGLTQHLSDHTCSISSSFVSTPHPSTREMRIKLSKFSTALLPCQGVAAVSWRRKKLHGGLAVCSHQLWGKGRITGCGHNESKSSSS